MKSRKDTRKRCGYRKGRKTQRGGEGIFAFLDKFNPFSSEKKEEGMPTSTAPSTVISRTLPPAPASASMPQSMSQSPSFTGGKRKYKKRATKKRSAKRITNRKH